MREVIIKSKIVGREGAIGGGKPIAFPDLSAYALRSDFIRLESSFNDFLEGDDTDNVINRWKELEAFLNNISEDYNLLSLLNGKADKATTLSGYGITDAYTKTNVDDLLKSYVTLGGTQTITGEKNFTGGLKVNGSPIVYDSSKKYWKLEGDLLVTGGVTMYGNEGTYTPSTIMDAIAVDGTTISKSGGVLKVIGGTGGGVADSVAWANITGKPTWIGSSKPTYSYSEITGAISTTELQNYLTSNSYINVTSGDSRYLKLSGGTLTGNILLGGTTTNKIGTNIVDTTSWQEFTHQNSHGYIAIGPFNDSVAHIYTDRPTFYFNKELYVNGSKVWNAGNDGSGSTLDADLLDGLHNGELTALVLSKYSDTWNYSLGNPGLSVFSDWNNTQSLAGYFYGISIESVSNKFRTVLATPLWSDGLYWRQYSDGDWQEDWRCLIDSYNIGSYNAGSATKLQTARTIWGQSFDGTGNVSGVLTLPLNHQIQWADSGGAMIYGVTNKRIIIDGSIGIGTTNPTCDLEINSSDAMSLKLNSSKTDWGFAYNSIGIYHSNSQKGGFGWNSESASLSNVGLYFKNYVSGDCISLFNEGGIGFIGGNIGIGTALNVGYKLAVNGNSVTNNIRTQSIMLGYSDVSSNHVSDGWYYASITYTNEGQSPSYLNPALVFKTMNNTYQSGTEVERMRICSNGNLSIGYAGNKGTKLYVDGNILAYGGITMYSDKRKKTIINHVELSLKQIAEAPLIEHYYNGDDNKTTHVGSIAQYWASLNDWFCKLDSEGYYTMEIQNAALASAISIARELDRYETKTDKAIKKLKKRICELEEEVERLKAS